MNPLTQTRKLLQINQQELNRGVSGTGSSWHESYKDSAWIFVGGLPYDLTEGDVIAVFSQYGEIVNVNLVRDKITGKQKGYAFLCYEDQRSTVLAVDNLNGISLLKRTLRVDHVANYKPPQVKGDEDELTMRIKVGGCGPEVRIEKLAKKLKKKEKLDKEGGDGGAKNESEEVSESDARRQIKRECEAEVKVEVKEELQIRVEEDDSKDKIVKKSDLERFDSRDDISRRRGRETDCDRRTSRRGKDGKECHERREREEQRVNVDYDDDDKDRSSTRSKLRRDYDDDCDRKSPAKRGRSEDRDDRRRMSKRRTEGDERRRNDGSPRRSRRDGR